MVHDILVAMGFMSIFGLFFGWEVDALFLTAMLTVIGFSVQDTIVVFDRIRETIRTTYGMAYPDMLNQSINRSLNRTMITSLSTLFVTLVMLFFGGPGLQGFALVLSIGVLTGTYSSSFVAAPVLYEYHEYRRRRQGDAPSSRLARAKKVR